jgi:hypothetical protein
MCRLSRYLNQVSEAYSERQKYFAAENHIWCSDMTACVTPTNDKLFNGNPPAHASLTGTPFHQLSLVFVIQGITAEDNPSQHTPKT